LTFFYIFAHGRDFLRFFDGFSRIVVETGHGKKAGAREMRMPAGKMDENAA